MATCRAAYSGTALAFRDRLIIEWNKTQQRQTFQDQKRVYCKKKLAPGFCTALTLDRSVPRIPYGKSS